MSLLDALLLDPARINVWVAYRTDSVKGSGTEDDPYDGSTADKFDLLINNAPANTTIRIGPGIFQSRGYGFPGPGVSPKSGQKIIGSGMAATVLKLVGASVPDTKYWLIGGPWTPFLDSFEASDLTLDCNLGGQSIAGYPFPPISCGGIAVCGKHIRLRRLRIINYGTFSGTQECFAIWSAGANPTTEDFGGDSSDCVTEDCILEQPSINNHAAVTCVIMGSTERLPPAINSDGVMAYHRGCVIRNCLIDCEYKDNPVPVSQIICSGTTATVTTVQAHGRAVNDWVRVSGALVNGLAANPFNGSFKVTSVIPPYQFQYTMDATPTAQPVGDMWVGRFPSHLVAITNLMATQIGTSNEYYVEIATTAPHFRVPGNNVSIGFVSDAAHPPPLFSNLYNGSFKVEDTTPWSPLKLTYKITSSTPPSPWFSAYPTGYVGVSFQAIANDGGTAAIVEGNRIFNCFIGGPYHDTWGTRDLLVRNNHYRAVQIGPYQNMGAYSSQLDDPNSSTKYWAKYHNSNPGISFDRIKRTGDGKTALFTTQYNHGFALSQALKITGAKIKDTFGNLVDPPSGTYNGYYSVDTIPLGRPDQFTYRMSSDPLVDAESSPIPQFATLWQVKSLVIENNLIELISSTNGYFTPIGILIARYQGDPDIGSQRLYKRLVIRGNVIRHTDDVSDLSPYPTAVRIYSAEAAVVEDNVVDMTSTIPIQHLQCDQVTYFNNRTPSGGLIQGVEIDAYGNPVVIESELTTDIEAALIMAF